MSKKQGRNIFSKISKKNSGDIFSESGFSLFELIVVISLIGILFIFIVPGFNNYFLNQGLSGIAKNIESTTKLLKHSAVKEQKTYFLNYDRDKRVLWVSYENMDRDKERDAIEKGIHIRESIRFEFKTSTDKFYIGFYKEGYSDKATINIYDNNRNITMVIKPLIITPEYQKS